MKNQLDKNRQRHGYWECYHSNGSLICRGNYKHGNRNGLWEYYYSTGELWYRCIYKNRILHGLWEYYSTTGELLNKGTCKRGTQVGLCYDLTR